MTLEVHESLKTNKRKEGRGVAGWEKSGPQRPGEVHVPSAFPLLAKIYLLVLPFLIQKDCLAGEPVKCVLDKDGELSLSLRTHIKCWAWRMPYSFSAGGSLGLCGQLA